MRLGPVHLTVRDAERSARFYQGVVGLRRLGVDAGGGLQLGVGDPLVVLHEDPSAIDAGAHAGLYHLALRLPSRRELGFAAERASRAGATAADHGVSVGVFLEDPDGIGIELYVDTILGRFFQPGTGVGPAANLQALDVRDLVTPGALGPPVLPPDTTVGHVHLHVADLAEAVAFYRDELGFGLVEEFGEVAFFSAGGTHHQVAVNTWRGVGVAPAPDGAVGLREWTLHVSDIEAVGRRIGGRVAADGTVLAADPSGNRVRLR